MLRYFDWVKVKLITDDCVFALTYCRYWVSSFHYFLLLCWMPRNSSLAIYQAFQLQSMSYLSLLLGIVLLCMPLFTYGIKTGHNKKAVGTSMLAKSDPTSL